MCSRVRLLCRIGSDEICFWASFLDGTQRVLLFTNDEFIARETQSVQQLEKVWEKRLFCGYSLGTVECDG